MILIKYSILVVALAFLASCGESANGKALAKEVCDCYTKANGLAAGEPSRADEQKKCADMQTENWKKVEGDSEQEEAFNGEFPCGI